MRKFPSVVLAGIFALASASAATAQVTLDFNGVSTPNTSNVVGDGATYAEDGYTFSGSNLTALGPGHSGYTGSAAVFSNDVSGVIRLVHGGGAAFDIFSVMIGNVFGPTGGIDVVFHGLRTDGSAVSQHFQSASTGGLQQFVFSDSFRGLQSVEFAQTGSPYEQYDNFVVADATVTPEPVSMALLGTGLAGLGAVRRRRRKAEENA